MQSSTIKNFTHLVLVQDLIDRKVSLNAGAILAVRVPPSPAPFNFTQASPSGPSSVDTSPSLSDSAEVNRHPRRLACLLHYYYKEVIPGGQSTSRTRLELRLIFIYSSSSSRATLGLDFGDLIPETDLTYHLLIIPNTGTALLFHRIFLTILIIPSRGHGIGTYMSLNGRRAFGVAGESERRLGDGD